MTMVPLLADDAVPPPLAGLFEAVEEDYGFVPNILRALANTPELATAFLPLWAGVYRSPVIGGRLRALAALGTARSLECTYCVAHMTRSARRAGLVDTELDAIGDPDAEQSVFDPREALILEVADALTQDPDGVTDDMRTELAAAFTPGEVVNIVLAIGMYNLTSRVLKALQIPVEDVLVAVEAS
ncbi:MAG: hypothetical protein AVDCRST_MAG41-2002 [uncultured Corynebacteriales bacterium]|uniref:Carboxymuconolactone decarboxylase-like domain-containing protein n=1 Tax=uncultured Mycobacteriales bacterium TaxID=581187 RepID=A0A6J4IFW9_9ACTN|nr:MAG: hypothetical protein AVDCRST_MAG41-2002 [uncultured Corynebacteriales bacterium]